MRKKIAVIVLSVGLLFASSTVEASAASVQGPRHGICGTMSSGWGGWFPGLFFGVFGWNCNLR